MPDIAIEITDPQALEQLKHLSPDCIVSQRRGMDGFSVSTIVLALGPLVIKGVVDIVKAQLEAKKHVRVKVNGTEVGGVSEKTLLALYEKMLKEKP